MKQKHYSLKQRLLISISFSVLVAGVLISILSFLFSWHEITEVYDAQMAHTAHVLVDLTESEIKQGHSKIKPEPDNYADIQHRYERKSGYRLWYKNELVLESLRAKDFTGINAPEGFSNQKLNGKPWRFFVYAIPEQHIRVEISQRYAIRYELINQLMLSLLIPAFLFLPVILGLIWIATEKNLKPLIALSTDVDQRHSDDLTQIQSAAAPREIMPLIQAMNRLFNRLNDSFTREREFTDHAAHELRTPLAAMKTQTQVLIKKLSGHAEAKDGLENLHATIDRSTRLIEQLLSLARLQNEKPPMENMDLSECLHDVIAELKPHGMGRGQNFVVDIHDHVTVHGNADSLGIMLRNFIDNAVKYTPDGGTVAVTLGANAVLSIADTGPGMNDSQKKSAFERFTRFDNTGQTGSGLGLSIAQWIAQTHGVTVTLENNAPTGLIVNLVWDGVGSGQFFNRPAR